MVFHDFIGNRKYPFFPMHPFTTPLKHHKTVLFSDVFRESRKGALGTNGLILEANLGGDT